MAVHKKAKDVHAWLQKNPDATVQEIAAEHDMAVDDVIEMLENHAVVDGKLVEVEAGAGGDWTPKPGE